jgi:tetratricopeptide (TPR) repeat protein
MVDSGEKRSWTTGRRGQLTRGLAVYLGVSYALLEVIDIFTDQLGLPDWFFRGVLYLLLFGLPIVVTTALVQGRRRPQLAGEPAGKAAELAAVAAEPAVQPAGAPRPWLTWQKAILGFVFAFAAWGLVTTAYMATRALGIGPVGSLVAAGVLDERERLIVADFENQTNDPWLGRAATEAFRIDLSQSTIVTVVDPTYVGQVLRRMQREPDQGLDVELAREVAIREGVKAVVAGEITRLGSGYVMTAQLVSAQDGQVIAPFRETANDSTEIIAAIDQLSKSLRTRIGESLKSIRANEPLDRVTTSSLEALRKYSQAVRVTELGDDERAIALLEEAVALDTAFAMAFRKLGVTLTNLGRDQERAREALTQAFKHRDRLTERERYLTEGSYYWGVTGENERAIAVYQSLLDDNPDDPWALNNLAILYQDARDFQRAEQLFSRAIEVDSTGTLYYGNVINAQVALGRFDQADYTLSQLVEQAPDHPNIELQASVLASAQFDFDGAEQHATALRESQRAIPQMQLFASFQLGLLAQTRGRLRESERHLREAMAIAEEQGQFGLYIGGAVNLAFNDIWFRGDAAAAVRVLESALARHPLETIAPLDRPYQGLAMFYALVGRPDRARAYLAEYDRTIDPSIRARDDDARELAEGFLALSEGRPDEAIREFRAADEGACTICVLPMLGFAYDQSAQPDSVIAVYERYLNTPFLGRLQAGDWFALGFMYERLGGLYELRGDRAQAIDYYRRFAELWEDADPDLQPRVEAARRAIERLAEES